MRSLRHALREHAALLAALVWLAATLWVRPLALPDEGRYAGVAWEMLRSGDWVVPTLDGMPYFHKPPLFYWITAAAMAVLGPGHAAARIAPWIGGALALASLWLFSARWAGAALARGALLVASTAPLFFLAAQYANLDMLVAGCITAAILAFAHAALLSPLAVIPRRRALLAGYALAALAVLAKGLIGVVIPGLAIGCWLLLERRWRTLPALLWWPGLLLFFVLAAPWFLAVQARHPEFAHYFFVVQHFQRYAQSGFNNGQPAWFYPVLLLFGLLPWTLGLAPAITRHWRSRLLTPVDRLMIVWVLVTLAFFSVPASKLAGYILPAAAPAAFLLARAWQSATEASPGWRHGRRLAAALACVACVGSVAGAAAWADRTQERLAADLAARVLAPDRVFFVEEYWFALPVLARLREHPYVVNDWTSAQVGNRDNWHRELLDAQRLDPASGRLLQPAGLAPLVCATAGSAWFVARRDAVLRYPVLGGARLVATEGNAGLWEARPADPAFSAKYCPEKPSASSGGMS